MIPPAKPGDRLTQDYVNRIIEQANHAERLSIPGRMPFNTRGGTVFAEDPRRQPFFDPCHMIYAVNTGTTDIEALTPAHIVGTHDDQMPPYSFDPINRRILKVKPFPTTMHRRNHGVIAFDYTKVGEVGRFYIDGLCIARINKSSRRFLTFAGWKMIWEENAGEVTPNTDASMHYAIVRYCGELGFWALLTAAEEVDDNRWKYSWTEKEWTMSGGILSYTTPTSPRTGPFTDETTGQSTGYAWNSTEMENTEDDTGAGWSDQTLNGFIEIMDINAVNQIGKTNTDATMYPVVWLEPLRLVGSNQLAYLFSGWNTPRFSLGGGS